ncbi:bactofilin family protein [Paenibacillus albus]|uniref:Polymer-forming cytoskeletal protein n=1 Tax=Paenibacillus albus TaxID=2495582 RepID=A0A3S9A1D0_9BACL|nr:polymer-forming cytoskeletal protein [Paenibacillus albus]AZN39506.1 polymer-forming cytoskeletal protein [Paenibacillus albus]
MFKWKKDKISSKMTDTFIGEGTIVEGTIRTAGSLRLEGQLRGDISCEGDVILGESGFAVSNITANNVVLAGQVNGNVTITGKLTIMSTGKLYGNMTAASLTIEEGGLLQGSSAMDQAEPVALNPMERRTGIERRVSNLPYAGEERRSGYDRRDFAAGEVPAIPKKISYRAIEKPADGAAEVEELNANATGAAKEAAKENNESIVTDPLRESGRAFIHSIAGSAKESGENAAAARAVSSRLNEGLNAEERAALSGILIAQASAAAAVDEAVVEAVEAVTAEIADVEAVTAFVDEDATVELVSVGEADDEAAVSANAIAVEGLSAESVDGVNAIAVESLSAESVDGVNAEAVESLSAESVDGVNAAAVETVILPGLESTRTVVIEPQSNNVYGYGFENRANGSETASELEHQERESANDRNAAEAAALLRNW